VARFVEQLGHGGGDLEVPTLQIEHHDQIVESRKNGAQLGLFRVRGAAGRQLLLKLGDALPSFRKLMD